MKSPVKQKPSTLQQAINNAMNGGGGTGGREVPEVKSTEDNYVLTADYGATPSYSWQPASGGGTQVQANWNESDTTAPSYIQNKPDLSDMATKTWVGQQGYLTDADEVPLPSASDVGKVLTATSANNYGWASGLAVETDGTNYWITVNSIRLYFASSAPTGTIPNGSLGIGW